MLEPASNPASSCQNLNDIIDKFLDPRKNFCNLHVPEIHTKRPKAIYKNDANGIENSEDPDQTAPLGAV